MGSPLPVRVLGGVPITAMSREGYTQTLLEDYRERQEDTSISPIVSFSANGEFLSMYAKSTRFAALANSADIIDADGQSLVLFSRAWPGKALPERCVTTDFFHDVARVAQAEGLSFYILGSKQEDLTKALESIRSWYPNLNLVGSRNGYFGDDEKDEVIDQIAKATPDVLWVGMGSPRQQEFCVYAKDMLKGVTWIKSCGGLFDYMSGRNSRAPLWVQSIGFEWLYRLALEPRRLFIRYLTTNSHALYLLLTRSKIG